MARIRTIKPEFWTDKKVGSWPLFTRLLYIGLWTAADDHGRGSAESVKLAAEIFPYDLSRDPRETLARISEGLDTLAAESRIVLYEVGGEMFYQVEHWRKHQRVDNASKPRHPTPYDDESTTLARPSRDPRETRGDSRLEQGTGNRDQGKDKDLCNADALHGSESSKGSLDSKSKQDENKQPRQRKEYTEVFERFWAVYPKRLNKGAAARAFERAVRRDNAETIIASAAEYAEARRFSDHQYTPMAERWLNSDSWLDDRSEWEDRRASPVAPKLQFTEDALEWAREGRE